MTAAQQQEHEARKEALEAIRPMVAAEETRSTNLNARALGVISASSVVTAIAAFFAKEVFVKESLEKLGGAQVPAIVLLIGSVGLLAAAVIVGVVVLLPRKRFFIIPDGIEAWGGGEVNAPEIIRQQSLQDMAGILTSLRSFNATKVRRLNVVYVLYAIAVTAIAADAAIFFGAAG